MLNMGVGKKMWFCCKNTNFLKHWIEIIWLYVLSVWYLLMCVLMYHGCLCLGLKISCIYRYDSEKIMGHGVLDHLLTFTFI